MSATIARACRFTMRALIPPVTAIAMTAAFATTALAQGDRGNTEFYVRAVPYVWFSNLGGVETLGFGEDDQVVGDYVVPVGDTVLATGWAARFEFGKGRLRGMVNLQRSEVANSSDFHLESDPDVSIPGSFDMSWLSVEMLGALQIGAFRSSNAVEVYTGFRYVRLNQNLDVTGSPSESAREIWVDPLIGGRYFAEMGGRFWAMFNGDIGGFGVGSRFTLNVGGELGFRVARPVDITMRYNYQEVEYDNGGQGAGVFLWENGAVQGWFFGVVLKR